MKSFLANLFSLPTLLTLTILSIAGMAGYYSIYGLMLVFSGAAVYVAMGAAAIEVGKLVLTSVLFHYWRKLNILLVTYCVVAVLALMAVTSWGVYGYLSAAYQKSQAPLEHINERIVLLDSEYERKVARLQQMDDIISSIAPNYVTKRLEEKKQQEAERLQLIERINRIEEEKLQLTATRLETEVHIGPIIKIADAFNVSPDRAVHWLIVLIMVVFDPLAVALTLCLNAIIRERRIGMTKDESGTNPVVSVPDNGVTLPPTQVEPIDTAPESELTPSEVTHNDDEAASETHANTIASETISSPLIPDEAVESTRPESRPSTDYDVTELQRRIDQLQRELYARSAIKVPHLSHENPLRAKLINDVRNGDLSES